MNLELLKKQLGRISIAMRKAEENLTIKRLGRIRGMRIMTRGRKVSNLLASEINRSNHSKWKSSQLEWWGKIQ